MRIDSSVIGMESARRYQSSTTKVSSFRVMDYAQAREQQQTALEEDGNEVYKWTDLDALQQKLGRISADKLSLREQSSTVESFRQLSLRFIFQLMFGSERTNRLFGEESDATNAAAITGDTQLEVSALSGSEVGSGKVLVYSRKVCFFEAEQTGFGAEGSVKTADGREISFHVDVAMSREFAAEYEEEFGFANIQTCDPLVLNFDGDVTQITDHTFYFDLDQDGQKESLNKLGSGSGYLALDLNENGTIDDGAELFGTKSGDGFKDLAAYDEDNNGWIDENDSIWSKLKIWCKSPTGDTLYTIAEKGVGAICLSNAKTDFTLQKEGETKGIVRKTGVFLYEQGTVGTIQHVDMVKQYLA